MEEKDFLLLLTKAKVILEKYETINKLKENFNIFEVLKLENLEVDLHSYFLYSLINNQKQSYLHEQFFKYFLEIVLKEEYDSSKKYQVFREYKIHNGRIDFYITTSDKQYAIEMKIYSSDSKNQLKKYQEFLDNHNKISKLYYLTLFGEEPLHEENKLVNLNLISFKDNISKWIRKCIEKSYDNSSIREILKQYLFIVNKLTDNIQGEEERMELENLLLKDDNLKIAMELSKAINGVKEKLEIEFWKEIENKCSVPLEKNLENYESFNELEIYKDINLNEKKLCFGLGKGKYNIYFFIGISDENNDWITEEYLKENHKLNEKFIKFQEKTTKSREKYKISGGYWKCIEISKNIDFSSNDYFYLLADKKQRAELVEEVVLFLEEIYKDINEVFDK